MDGARDAATIGLIGRERERSELRSLVAKSRVILVYGAAGIGKTSLVLDVCREAARAGTLPQVVHVSLAAVVDAREALERTAKAMSAPRPTPPPERLDDALGALLVSSPRTVVWDDIDDRSPMLAGFSWRIRTVLWAGGLYLVTSWLWILLFVPGWIAWTLISVWFLYRVVRGWLALSDRKPMPA